MHFPPPPSATPEFVQKLKEPVPLPNVQHCVLPDSVQSAFALQMRTVLLPVQTNTLPSDVAHDVAALHAMTTFPFVQLGKLPPVIGMSPQHTSEAGQSAGPVQLDVTVPEPDPEPVWLPDPEPGCVPEPDPELEPDCVPDPVPVPLPDDVPVPEPAPVPDPVPVPVPVPVPEPVVDASGVPTDVELEPQATAAAIETHERRSGRPVRMGSRTTRPAREASDLRHPLRERRTTLEMCGSTRFTQTTEARPGGRDLAWSGRRGGRGRLRRLGGRDLAWSGPRP
jgi:hypothetical protein